MLLASVELISDHSFVAFIRAQQYPKSCREVAEHHPLRRHNNGPLSSLPVQGVNTMATKHSLDCLWPVSLILCHKMLYPGLKSSILVFVLLPPAPRLWGLRSSISQLSQRDHTYPLSSTTVLCFLCAERGPVTHSTLLLLKV